MGFYDYLRMAMGWISRPNQVAINMQFEQCDLFVPGYDEAEARSGNT